MSAMQLGTRSTLGKSVFDNDELQSKLHSAVGLWEGFVKFYTPLMPLRSEVDERVWYPTF